MTRRVRLTLAGASSARAAGTSYSAAVWLLHRLGLGFRGRLLGQTGFELFLDLDELIRLGLEIARVRPLETCLELAADLPIGIAEMIVDGGIFRLELDRVFEVLDRLLVVADAEIGPSERVDDVAVIGALLDRTLNHLHAVVEIDALVDP